MLNWIVIILITKVGWISSHKFCVWMWLIALDVEKQSYPCAQCEYLVRFIMFWDNSNWDPACRWHIYFQPYSAFTHTMYTYPTANEKEREKLPLSDTPGFFTNYTLDRHSLHSLVGKLAVCGWIGGEQWMDILLTRFVLQAIARNSVHKQLNVIFTISTCGLWLPTRHRVSIVKSKWRFA